MGTYKECKFWRALNRATHEKEYGDWQDYGGIPRRESQAPLIDRGRCHIRSVMADVFPLRYTDDFCGEFFSKDAPVHVGRF